jgi:transcriptional regulator with XRE-family HTH domain
MEWDRIPNKLKSFRRRKGYSRKKVARVLGFSDTNSIYRWERGDRMPSALQLFQLATIYEVLPHDLYDQLWLDIHNDESLLISDETFNSNQQFYV